MRGQVVQQLVVSRYGGPEVFQMRTVRDPAPLRDEVRIRVAAAGVNFADLSARMGTYQDAPPLPSCLGYEVAGRVDAVGSAVDGLAVGDEVFGLTMFGGYADTVVVPAYQVRRIPEGVSAVDAASVPVVYVTAYTMLNRLGSVLPGETVLIHGVGGGVGLAALQLANELGAVVIGTASASKHDRLRGLGVDHLIDYRNEDVPARVAEITGGRGADVILDPVGGPGTRANYRSLAPLGRLFLYGVSSTSSRGASKRDLFSIARAVSGTPVFHPFQLMNANKGVFGINMNHLASDVPSMLVALDAVADRLARGAISPTVDRTWPLVEAGAAHEHLANGRNFGKVVLTVG